MSDLLNPDLGLPGDMPGLKVEPLVAHTPVLPRVVVDVVKYYWCTMPSASMHRTDGKRIAFSSKMYETDDAEDQKYLDTEVSSKNTYLRYATTEEIQAYKMRVNPRGTLEAELTPQIEERVRNDLEREILDAMRSRGIQVPDNFKLSGVDKTTLKLEALAAGAKSGSGTIVATSEDPTITASALQTLKQSSIVGSDKLAGNAAGSSSASSNPVA